MFKQSIFKLMGVSSMLLSPSVYAETNKQPNILFIFCDDLGYGDVGVFYQNSRTDSQPKIKTPHIDQLAKEGIQLRAHYVGAPVCAPSRATLFLGQSQGNAPIRDNQFDKALPDQPTLASTLQQAGYHTGLVGKWGLQGKPSNAQKGEKVAGNSKTWPSYPTKRGFDYYFGSVAHKDGHEHYPFDLIHFPKNKKPVPVWEQDSEISAGLKGCYSTDLFTAASKNFLVNHHKANPEKPFFLLLSYDTPHAATQIATMPYPEGFGINGGIQWIGKPGEFINTANPKTAKVDSYIHPDYTDKDWRDVSKRYASSIRRIDNSVADLIQTLKDLKVHDNTLIVFSSDHGPSKESYIQEQLDPSFFQSFGPFTGIKRDCWEGGIRPGAIAKWPGKIKPGSITEAPSQMQDWMATFCQAAGTNIPAISDGTSLIPMLTGETNLKPSTIYVEYSQSSKTPNYKQYPTSRAGQKRGQMQVVRVGDLKAIRYNVKSAHDPFLIFDLSKDPAEKNDLAGKEGIPDQQYWLDTVSRLHHKNPSAKRPYDGMQIAAVTVKETHKGAKFTPLKEGTTTNYLSRDSAQLTGYIKVDKAGKHTFSFAAGVKAILRIHQLHTLDTATKEAYPNNNQLNLAKGYHPFTIYLEKEAKASEILNWKTGKMKEATTISADHFSH